MMAVPVALLAPLVAATSSKSTSSSSGGTTLLILVVIAAAFYFLILRPQRQKQRAARELVNQWEIGDEVLTAGGIIGHIIDIEGDRVTLETSMGTSFEVLRQYVIRKLNVDVPDVEDHDDDEEYDHDADHDADGDAESRRAAWMAEGYEGDEHDHEAEDEDHDHDEHDDKADGEAESGAGDHDPDKHGPKKST
jgi:preprotein translocase subunit YajC